jgi:hypothetical protein
MNETYDESVVDKVDDSKISLHDEAILDILFIRPPGPMITTIEDFIDVRMTSLSFLS